MRSCRTCSPVNPLYCLVLFTGCLIKRDRKHDIPALKLRCNYVNSRSFWNPGLYLNSRKVGASSYSNKKTELSKHTNMTTKISCLDKPRFLNKNPPTQKDPLKKSVQNSKSTISRRLASKCGPDSKGRKEEAHKNTTAVKNKSPGLGFETLSWSDNTFFGKKCIQEDSPASK